MNCYVTCKLMYSVLIPYLYRECLRSIETETASFNEVYVPFDSMVSVSSV